MPDLFAIHPLALLAMLAMNAVPTLTALARRHPNTLPIVMFNLLVDWYPGAWLIAFVLSLHGRPGQRKEITELLVKIESLRLAVPRQLVNISTPLFFNLKRMVEDEWTAYQAGEYVTRLQHGEKAEAFIHDYIVRATVARLESGPLREHGELTLEGQQCAALFEHALGAMVTAGARTREWAESLRQEVYEGVYEAV